VVLHVLDNAPGQPQDICFTHQNTHTEYLPNNTTMLPQPPDQGITKTFKSYYTPHTLHSILDASAKKTFVNVSECWISYNIADCIANIERCMEELSPQF
jgi:DDE superfamily endonuclease.